LFITVLPLICKHYY